MKNWGFSRISLVLLMLFCTLSAMRIRQARRAIPKLYGSRATALSSTSFTNSYSGLEFVEGAVVEVRQKGGMRRATLVKRMKTTGMWKCSLFRENPDEVEKIIKVNSSELQLISIPIVEAPMREMGAFVESSSKIGTINLERVQASALHESTEKWIVFSDLHVKGSSIETCEQVLHKVQEEALLRNAGIIFLGDFWHVRGALSVELLNRVLKCLQIWTQPVIMIPGNHDQVTLGGTVHALEPLMYAFRPQQALLISEPAICMGALWIPYRRDASTMKAVLNAGTQSGTEVGMIFCHADVKGAFMNDGMRCREGLDIGAFPQNLPIYSGHFHKPHTMKHGASRLRYVGSPYQTSLSEAGQSKYLYCMTCKKLQSEDATASVRRVWTEDERWEIDVGKRHIKTNSVKDPAIKAARPGDRVVLSVSPLQDSVAVDETASELRDRGVEVELRYDSNPRLLMNKRETFALSQEHNIDTMGAVGVEGGRESAITNGDFVDPRSIFENFMQSFHIPGYVNSSANENETGNSITQQSGNSNIDVETNVLTSTGESMHEAVLREGRDTLNRIAHKASTIEGDEARPKGGFDSSSKSCDVRFDTVELSNFGPYGGKNVVCYPLSNRGLVLIRGQSSDGTGADSNGSGKTTLAMSVMWALTGSMDARLVADGKAVDVTFDTGSSKDRRVAEVVLKGVVNQEPFTVSRRRGARKAELTFELGGVDLTRQAVKDTQALIDEVLGTGNGLLQRSCFFGQHSHTMQSLLGLTDVKLKSELVVLADTSAWTAALQDVKDREKSNRRRANEIAVEFKVKGEYSNRALALLEQSEVLTRQLESEYETAKALVTLERVKSNQEINSQFGNITASDLHHQIKSIQNESKKIGSEIIQPLRETLLSIGRNKSSQSSAMYNALAGLREHLAKVRTSLQGTQSSIVTLKSRSSPLQDQVSSSIRAIQKIFATLLSSKSQSIINGIDAVLTRKVEVEHLLSPPPLSEAVIQELVQKLLHNASTTPNSQSSLLTVANISLSDAHKYMEATLAHVAAIDINIQATQLSIQRLEEVDSPLSSSVLSRSNGPISLKCQIHHKEECPTCGQELNEEARAVRLKEKHSSLETLLSSREQAHDLRDRMRQRLDLTSQLLAVLDLYKASVIRLQEIEAEIASLHASASAYSQEEIEMQAQLRTKEAERLKFENEFFEKEKLILRQIEEAESRYTSLQREEHSLSQKLQTLQQREADILSAEGKMNTTLALLEERAVAARTTSKQRAEDFNAAESVLTELKAEAKSIHDSSAVLERLIDVFGPRGIQHYVFTSIIQEIECIANDYLMILADGGIQLALESDEDLDKIVKSVHVRSNDGAFRERGLSQLSGGQWRRVSMALDLAFSEAIRRRGALRSNIIVMDEVLTHLDAKGREAVGTILRAMVAGPRTPSPISTASHTSNSKTTLISSSSSSSSSSSLGTANPRTTSSSKKPLQEVFAEDKVEEVVDVEREVVDVAETSAGISLELTRNLIGGGAYETVIVILQDLVAMELEEAFDHVDVVVKKGDTSFVEIDGHIDNPNQK